MILLKQCLPNKNAYITLMILFCIITATGLQYLALQKYLTDIRTYLLSLVCWWANTEWIILNYLQKYAAASLLIII